ncbi:MAG: 3'-5' exonuclease domain-containing protein 2 [Bacteroidales bacterium]|nr:3'-5' exonuclease domain-containing protein 2 [Bacteroidales bacterium]
MSDFIPTITKEEINLLPLANFEGAVVVVDSEELLDQALDVLNKQKVVGFDTETKPVFAKGKNNKVALLQIATKETCFLFRLNILGFSPRLIQFFNNPDILKIGLSIKDDFLMLRARSSALNPQGFIELQAYVKAFGVEDNSLQKIYAILFGKKISKAQRLSNWEIEALSRGQQHYAALDAWACLEIYTTLSRVSGVEF